MGAAAETLSSELTLDLAGRTLVPSLDLGPGGPVLTPRDGPRFDGLAEVGVGALGQVLQARDQDIGRRVAIKRMRDDRRSRAAYVRFVQEIRTVGALDHPNIVPIHDVGRQDDGGLFFVMGLVDGESMEAVLARLRAGDPATHAQWPFSRRVAAFRQVLHAIRYAHDRGVLHRDLKPANLMFGPHGEVRVVDWGVAKHVAAPDLALDDPGVPLPAQTAAGSLVGTPRYMSPEQARGEPVDERSEVFSLCLVLHEWLSLTHYLDDLDDVDEILAAIQTRDVPHPSALQAPGQPSTPPDLGWFVLGGLDRDPARRYPSVAAMIDRLERRDEGEVPIQCAATLQKAAALRMTRFVDRHPGLVTLAAVLVPLVLLAAGFAALAGAAGAGAALGAAVG